MDSSIAPYRGGLPPIRSRRYQRGTGFLSTLKRIAMPIAKTVLPQVFGGIKDVITGKDTALGALKRRGTEAAHQVLDEIVEAPPAAKRSRKQATPRKRGGRGRGKGRGGSAWV